MKMYGCGQDEITLTTDVRHNREQNTAVAIFKNIFGESADEVMCLCC